MKSSWQPEYREFIETYIDDLMTHSSTFDDHLRHLETLLQTLQKHNLTVKLSKCKFAQKEVKFLGHIISHKQLKMNPESVDKILEWQRPKSGVNGVKAVRGFLGMAGWYRKFIKNFSHIAKPLYELTKKDVKWHWTDECEKAFQTLRDAITKYPVLMAPDPNKDYILETDASDEALSATLLQRDDNDELHPVAYASKTLNDAQRNYTVTDREALAIVWGLEHFNTFCEGHKYTAITDHAALKYLYTAKNKTPRLHRLLLRLQPYEVTLHYRPGKDNHAADLLSRSDSYMELSQSDKVEVNAVSTRKRNRSKASTKHYEVERIVEKRLVPGRADEYEYRVKWRGYDDDDNTWEPLAHLDHATEMVAEFEQKLLNRQRTPSSSSTSASSLSSKDESDQSMKENHDDEKAKLDEHTCDVCHVQCRNNTDLYIHQFREHQIAIPTPSYETCEVDRELLLALQRREPQFAVIFDSNLGEKDLPHATTYEDRMMATHEFVLDKDNILYCVELPGTRTKSKLRTQLRMCIPKQMRKQIMKEVHEGSLSAHPGVVHMYDKLREYAWWPRMLADVVNYVKNCQVCQCGKSRKHRVPTQPVTVPLGPWTHVSLDWVGPLPTSEKGNKYILVAKCQFLKYVEAFAAPDLTAQTTAELVVQGIICRYGLPLCFTTDRGQSFVSHMAGHIYKQLGIKQSKTTSHHPQSNGNVEISNKQLKQTLKLWSNEHQSDWDVLLPYAVFAYNTSYHSLLQETPFYASYGRDARLTMDVILGKRPEHQSDVHEYATELVQRLYDVHQRIREILQSVNDQRVIDNDEDSMPKYNVGDEVYLYDPTTTKGLSRKLVTRWKGPYTVIEKHSPVTYKIMKDGKSQVVHVERLRKKSVPTDDQYTDELQIMEDELQVIEQSQQRLLQRQQETMQNKAKVEAEVESRNHVYGDIDDANGVVSVEFTYLDVHDTLSIKW
jgi:transposase InsO family protein